MRLAATLNDRLVNVRPRAVIDTPAATLSEVDANTINDTLANVDVVALVERQMATFWATSRPRLLLTHWTRHNRRRTQRHLATNRAKFRFFHKVAN